MRAARKCGILLFMEQIPAPDTYLFFDIESANSSGGVGHICSFGYVLTDSELSVIETDDIVMNPRSFFEERLLAKGSDCRLAYRESYFLEQPDFTHFHERIMRLLTAPRRLPVGFAVRNDVDFIVCACMNFGLPQIDFSAYDIHFIVNRLNDDHAGLSGWIGRYGIDVSHLHAHKSCDDAMMTMLLAKKICAVHGSTLPRLFSLYPGSLVTSRHVLQARAEREERAALQERIAALYEARCERPRSHVFDGEYVFSFGKKRSLKEQYAVMRMVHEHGGTLLHKLRKGCVFVMEDGRRMPQWLALERFDGVRIMYVSDVYERLGLPEP